MSRSRWLVLIVPFLVVGVLLTTQVWGSRSSRAEELAVGTEELQTQLVVQERRLERAQQYDEGGSSSQQALLASRAALPEVAGLGSFVTANERVADETGVEVLSVVPEPADSLDGFELPDGLQRLGVDVTIRGGQEDVVRYMDQLGNLPRLTLLEDVQLTAEGDEFASAALSLAIFHH